MSTLSQGPYNYNRFAAIDDLRQQERRYFTEKAKEKKAKPDFLDVDDDRDEKDITSANLIQQRIVEAKKKKEYNDRPRKKRKKKRKSYS